MWLFQNLFFALTLFLTTIVYVSRVNPLQWCSWHTNRERIKTNFTYFVACAPRFALPPSQSHRSYPDQSQFRCLRSVRYIRLIILSSGIIQTDKVKNLNGGGGGGIIPLDYLVDLWKMAPSFSIHPISFGTFVHCKCCVGELTWIDEAKWSVGSVRWISRRGIGMTYPNGRRHAQ